MQNNFDIIHFIFGVSCDHSRKSWETIYSEQEKIFNNNRKTFEASASVLNAVNNVDTTLSIKNNYLQLADTLIESLKNIGIAKVAIRSNSCSAKSISFLPVSPQWSSDRFYILEVRFDMCDDRNRKGYHWQLEGSEHKHSFGQGDGWLIYSDSDFL